jgi:shikimate kinase
VKNLVLIGMPGCGKTAVGQALSALLKLPLVDTDALVESQQGRSIPDIFARDGEAAFRDMETRAVRTAAAMEGTIIATGGGVVLRAENMAALAETGVIFFRDRAVEDIVGENHTGRPLIGNDRQKVYDLYTQRIELYRKYAQYTISHTKTVEEAAARIAALYEKEEGRG